MLHGLLHGAAHVGQGRMARAAPRQGAALDHAAQAVNVGHAGGIGHGHGNAPVRRVCEQAFLREQAKGLAQGVARNAQLLPQGAL